ncbi:hypothetical protein [Chitinophaga filiformis]|uniref:Uncharacterized protein n=1 Tax=Chitinophaga filiformis TaxID=104663 RepID=A0A1G7NW10_CHIFI|nr:hypothetical protein [Chitinophaga filiformis]SDF78278.1 hypothetical protein SAMN04488121_102967 [Chitinophaga filiformis]
MKNKLRKIRIESNEYLYAISNKYENGNSTLIIRVFLKGYKDTPLMISFFTPDDPITGNPLKTGFDLVNHTTGLTYRVNIHEPKYIKELILQGIRAGWSGKNKIGEQNGIDYLKNLRYETKSLSQLL